MSGKKERILSERQLIAEIAAQQKGSEPENLIQGIGDDCAVQRISEGRVSLLTTDTLVEGVHFDPGWHPQYQLGRKSVSVNVSDIAAMGGHPQFALLSLGIPKSCDQLWLDDFLAGFTSALKDYHLCLIGGDTVHSGERFMVSVTVIGEMAEESVCYRSGAQSGDLVWVSGFLGDAAAGLELCRRGMTDKGKVQTLVNAHLDPEPRVALGEELARSGLVHAMMDVSDGLATDLAHICTASGVGAEIDALSVPLSDALQEAAACLQIPVLDLALQGGEDYQLVFTTSSDSREKILSLVSDLGQHVSCVGRIIEGSGVILCQGDERMDISYRGYEHIF
ncbi:MAG: thiamine-phosphate kinase [Desulfobulbaceae bacterium]|uniref:Thiamine-monophosphate kinase n=1 Tax=Candidatus Desulfobia pelagia TaxID=2841692 RepID=A0A8J6NGZ3_9BACT|nr:thiamine-phosphate kinase [Candidatus Desulfobia pelagia]